MSNRYDKTQWLNRSDPAFDPLTSPEVDADNLNKIENGIYDSNNNVSEVLKNLAAAHAEISTSTIQEINIEEDTMQWITSNPSNDQTVMQFNDLTKTFTIKKPGSYNFASHIIIGSTTGLNTLITVKIIDSALQTIWHTESTAITANAGEYQVINSNKGMRFLSSDLPKTLKIVVSADAVGTRITSMFMGVNMFVAGVDVSSHKGLSDTSEPNCHPISAITNLSETLSGSLVVGEAT